MPDKKLLLTGIAASSGVAEGRARIFLPGDSAADFKEGEILVTTITDPTMVSAMIKAVAIVTNFGGITSHSAILSREMGVPCVVNTEEATKKITTGQRLLVDGMKGEVHTLN